jgi:hypothetical protein
MRGEKRILPISTSFHCDLSFFRFVTTSASINFTASSSLTYKGIMFVMLSLSVSTLSKLKGLLDRGGNRTRDFWFANPIQDVKTR